jgi:hypothetical protein
LPLALLADAEPHRWPSEFVPPPAARTSQVEVDPPQVEPAEEPPTEWAPEWNRQDEPQPLSSLKVAQSKPPEADSLTPASPSTNRSQSAITDVPTPSEMERHRSELRGLSDEELFAQLGTAEFFERGAVALVLERRGYQRSELELGTKLVSPDESRRLELVDEVWLLPAARARHWLKMLLMDENPKIRLRALSALATTDDPQLYDLTKRLVLEDRDEKVVKLAERFMRETK